ncbi:MAG: GEVED domain-containing protein [Hyphomicrobiales bacterium]
MKLFNFHKIISKEKLAFLFIFFLGQAFVYGQSDNLKKALNQSVFNEHILYNGDDAILTRSEIPQYNLTRGELLVLKVLATPSTGYQWEIIDNRGGTIEQIDIPLYESCERPEVPGAPVYQYIVLKPVDIGTSELSIAYQRPWKREESRDKTMSFIVRSEGEYTGDFSFTPMELKVRPVSESDYKVRNLPSYYNLAEQGKVTPVRDQGTCGSCWAFGSVAGFESKILKKDGNSRDLSEQYAVSCNDYGFSCAGGWWVHDVWEQYVPAGESGAGAVYESDFPYQSLDVDCAPPHDHYEQIEGWAYTDDVADTPWPTTLHDPSIAQVKQKLYEWGSIPTALCLDNWNTYTGGVLSGSTSEYTSHIVLVTGWDDSNQCWIIKNSWGGDWGEDGYIRIAYGSHLTCQYSTYLKYDKTNPRLVFQGSQFYEAIPNNGVIRAPLKAKLLDAGSGFSIPSGLFEENTHFKAHNVPAGLQAQVKVLSNQLVQVSLLGTATNHLDANDANVNIEFLDAAFADHNASDIENSNYTLSIDFFDPYEVVYHDMEDLTVTTSDIWEYFTLQNGVPMGLWYSFYYDPYPTKVNTFFLETYTKKAVCNTSGVSDADRMLTPMNYGEVIDGTTNYFVTGGSYGDQHRIYNEKYTQWANRTAYVGISFGMYGGTCYGWLRLRVTPSSVTILDYAYNEEPYAPIQAGYSTATVVAPIADFIAEPLELFAEQQVTFTDKSIRSPENWNWTIEGGTPPTSTETNPIVVFNDAGVYDVTMEVSNDAGSDTKIRSDYITVYPAEPPVVIFEHTKTVPAGATVKFTDESENLPYEWRWSFEGATPPDSDQQNPTVQYNNAGTFDVELIATNVYGATVNKIEDAITVVNVPTGYCTASNDNDENLYIQSVQLADLYNMSESSGNGYENHTSKFTELEAGKQYEIIVGVHNNHWESNALGIWIDYNGDGDFTDSNETIHSMNGTSVYSKTFTVPTDVAQGMTRMRIRAHYDKTPFPCGNDNYLGEVEDYSILLGEPVPDLEPPTKPENLTASVSGITVNLTWSASTDDIGVAKYNVFKDDNLIGSTPTTNYSVTGLSPEVTYTFTVQAEDLSGKVSEISDPVEATTLDIPVTYCAANNQLPSNFYIKKVMLGTIDNTSTYAASGYSDFTNISTDLEPGHSYTLDVDVHNDHWPLNALGAWIDWNHDGDFDDSGETITSMTNNGSYEKTFTVPMDAARGMTRMRVRIHYDKTPYPCDVDTYQGEVEDYTVNVGDPIPDIEDPSAPANLTGVANGTIILLSWDASTDDVGVSHYNVYKGGSKIATSNSTSFSVTGNSPSTTYRLSVQAEDFSGKLSLHSTAIEVTTGTATNTNEYCTASASYGPEHISRVQFANIDKSSGRLDYSDYTSLVANVIKGQYVPLTVDIGDFHQTKVSAWIDWNNDGDFDDADEYHALTISGTTASKSIYIPTSAVESITRMRIRCYFYAANNKACNAMTHGEVEDYSLFIAGANAGKALGLDEMNVDNFDLYPNPSEGAINMKYYSPENQNVKFAIYNVYGMMVWSHEKEIMSGINETTLLPELASGTYYIIVKLNDKEYKRPFVIK